MREQLSKQFSDRNPEVYLGIDFTSFPAAFEAIEGDRRENGENECIIYSKGFWRLITNNPNHYITEDDLKMYTL